MDDEEKIDLFDYLPEYLKEYHEIREIMQTENEELQAIEKTHQQCIDDRFAVSCGEYGIKRFERLLKITPIGGETLEIRRLRVMSNWDNMVPYHYVYLKNQLKLLCGEQGYHLQMDFSMQTIKLGVELTAKHMLAAVKEMLYAIIPCNIRIDIELIYNRHITLGKFTHGQLRNYTYKQLREDVIL